jgi:ribosomal protein L13E
MPSIVGSLKNGHRVYETTSPKEDMIVIVRASTIKEARDYIRDRGFTVRESQSAGNQSFSRGKYLIYIGRKK